MLRGRPQKALSQGGADFLADGVVPDAQICHPILCSRLVGCSMKSSRAASCLARAAAERGDHTLGIEPQKALWQPDALSLRSYTASDSKAMARSLGRASRWQPPC